MDAGGVAFQIYRINFDIVKFGIVQQAGLAMVD